MGMGIELEMGRAQEEDWVRGAIVGAGASGTVSLAMSSSNGQLFAIKSAAGFSDTLDNEYQILRCLDSPHIVRCLGSAYSFENGAGLHNLFMEYMPAGSLGDLLGKFGGKLHESVIRAYTLGILRGIDYLHSQGIVHCDIKGKNVLVDTNGVKLGDFGSAKRFGDEEKGQEALELRGTPLWMAPEVVNQVEQGPASDIWSLACTVLEMTTGRLPWSHVSSPLAAMYRIGCTEELPELPAGLSPQIRDFLEKCFRRDPKKRWTSTELLNHPFLNEDCSAIDTEEAISGPGSPTSPLDFRIQLWDSYSSQTTPILSVSIPNATGECTEELPELPAGLSPQIRDFLEKCFRRDPKKRWTSTELLNHPFLNEDFSAIDTEEAISGPGSPTSHLDFRIQLWDSYASQTTPILSVSIPNATGECNAEVNRSVEQCCRPSPRDRVKALAGACKFENVSNRANWITKPHGEWIDVRSSRSKSPTSHKPLIKSDISNGSSIQELPFTEEICSTILEAVNWEELQPTGELDQCLEAAVSAAQPQDQPSSSTSAKTLHHNLFSMAVCFHPN